MRTLFFFLICAPFLLAGQKHDNTWMYGAPSNSPIQKMTQMVFSAGECTFIPTEFQGEMNDLSSSMSDSAGNLLFYTNGCHVYDRSGAIMDNGDTLNGPANSYWSNFCGGTSSIYKVAHGAFALPSLTQPNQYNLFHVRARFTTPSEPEGLDGLYYTTVDMNALGGLGRVVKKNVPLVTGSKYQNAAAVRHGNGRDWWVMIPEDWGNKVYRRLMTPQGIEPPLVQEDTAYKTDSLGSYYHKIIFTPDGRKCLRFHGRIGIFIYDFDRCTGILSNPVLIAYKAGPPQYQGTDLEVSSNSRFLYIVVDNFMKVLQYDLQSDNIPMSGDTIARYDGYTYPPIIQTVFGHMERAPNGKIYFTANACPLMHVIDKPDLPGIACDFMQRGVLLPTWNFNSLPYFPNYRLYDLPDSPCDTLGINGPVSAAHEPKLGDDGIHLAPNPASEYLSIESAYAAAQPVRLRFYDAQGALVQEQAHPRGVRSYTMDVSGLAAGCYFVELWLADGGRAVKRVVVVK